MHGACVFVGLLFAWVGKWGGGREKGEAKAVDGRRAAGRGAPSPPSTGPQAGREGVGGSGMPVGGRRGRGMKKPSRKRSRETWRAASPKGPAAAMWTLGPWRAPISITCKCATPPTYMHHFAQATPFPRARPTPTDVLAAPPPRLPFTAPQPHLNTTPQHKMGRSECSHYVGVGAQGAGVAAFVTTVLGYTLM